MHIRPSLPTDFVCRVLPSPAAALHLRLACKRIGSSWEVYVSTGLAVWTNPLLDLQKDGQPQHVYFDSTEGESQSNDDSHLESEDSEAASEDSQSDGEEAASEDEPMTDADEQTPSAAGRDLTERATSVEGVEADSSSQQVGLEARMLQA